MNVGSLFSGIGGMDEGLRRAGWHPAYTEFIGNQLIEYLKAAQTEGEAASPNREMETSV